MKIIKIKNCKNCPNLGSVLVKAGIEDACFKAKKRIKDIEKIPKWCPLKELKGE